MRKLVLSLLALALACGPVASPRSSQPADSLATSAATGDLPAPVREAFQRLDRELSAKDRATICATPPEGMIDYHFGLGMYIRNEYGLWSGGPLQEYFRAQGMEHPDDMSGVLLDAYRLYLCGEPVRMDSLIAAVPPPKPEAIQQPDSVAAP